MKNSITTGLLLAGLLSTSSASAAITNIFAGDSVGLSGITLEEDPTLFAQVLQDTSEQFMIADPAGAPLIGTLHSRAAQRMDTGELDFYWNITIESGKTGQISSVIINGFAGWSVGVEYRLDGVGSIGPSDASRSVNDQFLGYHFNDPLLSFVDSRGFFARTEAFEYDFTGTAQIIMTNGESVTLSTFAPNVPTPGGLALLGMVGLGAARRRRA